MTLKQDRARAVRSITNVTPVDVPEIARRAGVRNDTVRKWRKRYADTFPQPRWRLTAPLWEWTEVAVWIADHQDGG